MLKNCGDDPPVVDDAKYTQFLQWALPRLHMRWPGFRKVREQVCKRIRRRLRELGIPDIGSYRDYLEAHAEEWSVLDTFCRITISRFYRDRDVFDFLGATVLPQLARTASARGESEVRAWSAGCASGEEIYTVKMLWRHSIGSQTAVLPLRIVATDVEPVMLDRARCGCYTAGSLKDLPRQWLDSEFVRRGAFFCVREELREGIEFRLEDIREAQPAGPFHLILCRYLAFTYFAPDLQLRLLTAIVDRLVPSGVLVTGKREPLPGAPQNMTALAPRLGVYRKEKRGDMPERGYKEIPGTGFEPAASRL
jgi:chemotaxis protein methyltransferase CheR